MNNRTKSNGYGFKILEELSYVTFVVLGFYLAFLLRFDMNPLQYNLQPFYDNIPYIIVASLVVFYFYNIVSTVKKTNFENVITICIALFMIDIIVIAIVFFNRGFAFPRSVILIGYIIQFLLVFILKVIVLKIIKHTRKKKDILIIAPEEEAKEIAIKLLIDKSNFDNLRYICNKVNENIFELINASEKIYIGNDLDINDKLNIMRYCSEMNKDVYLIPGLYELAMINSKATQVNDILIFKVDKLGLSFEQILVKRLMDIIISILGLTVMAPILLIASVAIKFYDGGPILFKQERVTEENKIFELYKFRSMIVDAEKNTGPVLATDKDPRITPLGKLLRATRVDEFPQLINVLKGDMSLVGPRPERPYFVEKYNCEIEEFKYRVYVKAGVTGLAQILGKYSTNPENKAKYDLLYIRNYSLMLDIKIIFNTVKIMFIKDSSAGVSAEKKLRDIFEELNLKGTEEMGITRVDNL